jgi:RimJ/RimL family protein N-acetyltransferase
MSRLQPHVIETSRLVLVPLEDETAKHITDGDMSCLEHTAGWPHADTLDGIRLRAVGAAVWLVGLDGVVIGDCGTVGPVENGMVEIGFGLAEEHRGLGYGGELVAALSDWLLAQDGVGSVVATTDVGNVASRCVLEKTGFELARVLDGVARYIRDGR